MSGRVALVTGTDTGVGKTHVACALARALRAGGRSVAVRKPAETGCGSRASADVERGGAAPSRASLEPLAGAELFPPDAAALRVAAASDEALAAICPYRFAEPLAPGVAALRAGVEIDVARLAGEARRRAREVDVLLVEGAGGLLVPLRARETFADLAVAIEAALVVVVGARLGAINQTLLTLEAGRSRGLAVAGVVVNHCCDTQDLATATLAATLRELLPDASIVEVPFGDDASAALAPLAAALCRGV